MPISKRILILAGPSGGHLFPAYAFAESLRQRLPESALQLVTGQRAQPLVSRWNGRLFEKIHYLHDFPYPRGFSFKTFQFLIELTRGFIQSSRFLSSFQPELCVGFGSYIAYPGLVLSAWKKIPVLLHEQNLLPGQATDRLIPHANHIAVSFEETYRTLKPGLRSVTGLPIRSALRQAAQTARASEDGRFRVLVVGGSQGAHRLNQIVLDGFSRLDGEEKTKYAVIHITGKQDFDRVKETYASMEIAHQVFPFVENMQDIYSRADMAVTRSGANTLFELALFRLPAIVIPYPYAGGHQSENAKSFAASGAIIFRDEESVSADWLMESIRGLRKDKARRDAMSQAIAGRHRPDAADRLANLAQSFLCPKP